MTNQSIYYTRLSVLFSKNYNKNFLFYYKKFKHHSFNNANEQHYISLMIESSSINCCRTEIWFIYTICQDVLSISIFLSLTSLHRISGLIENINCISDPFIYIESHLPRWPKEKKTWFLLFWHWTKVDYICIYIYVKIIYSKERICRSLYSHSREK